MSPTSGYPTPGATPLLALSGVAFDMETTGLDTSSARILEIAGVGLDRGALVPEDRFATLVDPQLAIPPQSQRIHGITNAMVRQAPAFTEALPAFETYRNRRVVIGYALGFDFAILEREARRAGLAWEKPRALCVRLLASLLDTRLPDDALDTIAAWLGIRVEGRHRAEADAMIAAEVFLALVPRLAERGIRTLAEAERACLQLTEQRDAAYRAGWAEPISPPGSAPATGPLDPYAYRHRVADVMSASPVVMKPDDALGSAIGMMTRRRISSVFVADPADGGRPLPLYGIVTERDVMRALAEGGASALERTLGSLASKPLAAIRAEAFVYRAIGRMDRLGIRHLAVRDEAGLLVGIVSARDLLRLRASSAIGLDDAIDAAADATDLAAAWATLPAVVDRLLAEDLQAPVIAEIVSEELCTMTRRAAQLAEARMAGDGRGPPPVPYAVLVLGSGGRGESLLAADQDNAIVYAEGESDSASDRWFADFAHHMNTTLGLAGVALCKGGVMARNAPWRGSTATWKARVEDWIRRSSPDDLLNVDIVFDLRPVHGRAALGDDLLRHAYARGAASPAFAKLLGAQEIAAAPVSVLGRLRTENGRIDLKRHGLFPIVAFARTLSIRHHVLARATARRIRGIRDLQLGADADLDHLAIAHGRLVGLLLRQQSRDLDAGIPVSNRLDPAILSAQELKRLKDDLQAVRAIPSLLHDLMFAEPAAVPR